MSDSGNTTTEKWLSKIKGSKASFIDWEKDAEESEQIFRSHKKKKKRFNILHSNVQTMKRAIYGNAPKPDVRRRHKDSNPIGREVAEILERAIGFTLDTRNEYDFDTTIEKSVMDGLIAGRGTVRVDYLPYLTEDKDSDPDEKGNYPEQLADEVVLPKFVYWKDFSHENVREWCDCGWISYRHQWTKEEAEENGIDPEVLKFNTYTADGEAKEDEESSNSEERAELFEIWDKSKRQVVFVQEGQEKVLKTQDDPYNLQGFFNCPPPLYMVTTNDSLTPVCEYKVYKDLADDLERVTVRLYKLTSYIKAVGVFDKETEELVDLLSSSDGTMIGATNYTMMAEKGGMAAMTQFLPIDAYVQALSVLEQRRDRILQNIYEITGISDIMRGQTAASESATAQRIKGNFGTLRLQDKQKEVARFARDIIRLIGELISEKFQPETISMMTGLEVTEKHIDVMRSDILRKVNIDIETDSTIVADEAASQEAMTKLLGGVTQFVTGMAPAVEGGIVTKEQVTALLKEALRAFKMGRVVENIMDDEGDENSPQGQMAAIQGQMQEMGAALQQKDAQIMQISQQLEANNAEIAKAQFDDQKHQREMERDIQKHVESEKTRKELALAELGEKRLNKMVDLQQDAEMEAAKYQPLWEAEEDVKEVAEQIGVLVQAVVQNNQQVAESIAQQNEVMMKMVDKLTAPKKVIYDEKTGQVLGTEVVEEVEQNEGEQ